MTAQVIQMSVDQNQPPDTLGDLLTRVHWLTADQLPAEILSLQINDLVSDSRQVSRGDVFLAVKTPHGNGLPYINQAMQQGAACCLIDSELLQDASRLDPAWNQYVISVLNLSAQVAKLANDYYAAPSRRMNVIGITGTNGKSSCVHFLAQMGEYIWGKPGGLIGTLGWGVMPALEASTHTTPDSVMLQRQLHNLVESDVSLAAIEVSSHALLQQRTAATCFAITAFTNLSQDHLDYHISMQSYAAAKKRLFTEHQTGCAVIGLDDEYGVAMAAQLRNELATDIRILTTSAVNKAADICVQAEFDQHSEHIQGLIVNVTTPWGTHTAVTQLLGGFNAANLATCVACLGALDVPFAKMMQAIEQLQPVPGRMQCVMGHRSDEARQPLVIVDYAHTPDALENALNSSRQHTQGKLWCVFGCGGDRDRSKRPQMGGIAEQLADQIIITSDNPRHEQADAIIQDVCRGLQQPAQAQLEADRARAIRKAILEADPNDCILIAGKGHEQTQQIGDEQLPFDDVEVASRALEQRP